MVPSISDFDGLCEFALNFLLNGEGDARRLAARLAGLFPDLPALELVFVIATAASGMESVFAGPETVAAAQDAWRIAALLAVDLHQMQVMDLPHATCGDLMRYWRTEDGFFLA